MGDIAVVTSIRDAIASVGAGTWPDWLAAIATSSAFLIAVRTYVKSRRDDHVRQARKVYVLYTLHRCEEEDWVDTGEGWAERGVFHLRPDEARGYQLRTKGVHVRATVHNASDEVISNVEVVVSAENVDDWPQGDDEPRYVVAAVPPGSERVVDFVAKDLWRDELSVSGLELSVRVRFTDAAGNHWSRQDARPIRELRRHDVGWFIEPGLHTQVRVVRRGTHPHRSPLGPGRRRRTE